MKKFLILFLVMASTSVQAQDVIVKKDGTTILSKVLEVNQNDIKYKKHSNSNGPTYVISISDIMAINYANGDKDHFNVQLSDNRVQTDNNNVDPRLIVKEPDARNAEIINMYKTNCTIKDNIKCSNSDAKACYSIWEIAPSSVMSNDDVEIRLIRDIKYPQYYGDISMLMGKDWKYGVYPVFIYSINIFNKSDQTIYVDRANCFRILEGGEVYCYYDTSEQTTISNGKGSGAMVGLGSIAGALGVGGAVGKLAGGVVIGGESSNTVSTTYSQQRILAIPPHSSAYLKNYKQIETKPYKIVVHAEYFLMRTNQYPARRGFVKKGQVLTYNKDNSPWKRSYILTYSTNQNFKSFTTQKIDLFIHQIIGCDKHSYYSQVENLDRYLNGISTNSIIALDYLEK